MANAGQVPISALFSKILIILLNFMVRNSRRTHYQHVYLPHISVASQTYFVQVEISFRSAVPLIFRIPWYNTWMHSRFRGRPSLFRIKPRHSIPDQIDVKHYKGHAIDEVSPYLFTTQTTFSSVENLSFSTNPKQNVQVCLLRHYRLLLCHCRSRCRRGHHGWHGFSTFAWSGGYFQGPLRRPWSRR